MWSFIARVLSSKYKDIFVVRLGVNLTLSRLGITGPLAKVVSPIISGLIGLLMEVGVFKIDLTIDAYREGQKLEEFKKQAKEAYDLATKKVYTEEEKQKIRNQYLAIISKFGQL